MFDNLAYDTLEDLTEYLTDINSARDMVAMALGVLMSQPVVGILFSGVYTHKDILGWGTARRLGSTAVYVRSAPRGRAGTPIVAGEMRVFCTLCISLKTGKRSLSVAKLYLPVVHETMHSQDHRRDSCAPLSMPAVPMLIFSDHKTPTPGCVAMRSAHGHKLITPNSVTLVEPNQRARVQAGQHESQIAAAVIGLQLSDTVLRPMQIMRVKEWDHLSSQNFKRIEEEICQSSSRSEWSSARDVFMTAAVICEDVSASGFIDLMSTPALLNALPDALERPDSILCVIAAMTRIAAYPDRLGLEHGTMNDVWAAAELASCFEAGYSPVANSKEGRFMAIDMALRVSFHHASQSSNADIHNDSVNHLFQCGVALCLDCFGPISGESSHTKHGYTKTGDCVCLAHLAEAHAKGMGKLPTGGRVRRLNCRAERQTTLLRILDRVELFLRNGVEGKRDANCYVAPEVFDVGETGTDSEDEQDEQDQDQDQDQLNIDGVKAVVSILQRIQTRGIMCLELERLNVYPVSSNMILECSCCKRMVHLIEARMFSNYIPRCCACLRPCCSSCVTNDEATCPACTSRSTHILTSGTNSH